ncbi:MAG: hypothetical protein GTN89_02620 [Acidobacteria bacterium]|nr:hypothetical protein [Acidobacteriota bacterium]NIM62308.1 hypothetical protein [Acidobacteriota bacterium]NIO58249.1 hypothetical protein [Acidobacteriota bacterium]NIQ29278.1 hypothetical protein [Acidobacteriota bacterium]NIQ83877.1 hypothetical protein [Acidobacteriota bacterium]
MRQAVFLALVMTLLLAPGAKAVERGGADTGPGQFGISSAPQVNDSFRSGGWVERKNREGMVSRVEERLAPRAFRLNASGGINLATGMVLFSGTGTHVGLYRGTGFLDPTFVIFGAITAANGDALEFTASFEIGTMGNVSATFIFVGGTGRFEDAAGQASGPVTLNPDFTFSIDVAGFITY